MKINITAFPQFKIEGYQNFESLEQFKASMQMYSEPIEEIQIVGAALNKLPPQKFNEVFTFIFKNLPKDAEIFIQAMDIDMVAQKIAIGELALPDINRLLYDISKGAYSLRALNEALISSGFEIITKGYTNLDFFIRAYKIH